jgi:N-acetylglucosaminyldiphosphoundecaprenol N-acetyl-beta-D-mannosaminyltransferase
MAATTSPKVEMFGVPFDRVDLDSAVAQVEAAIADRSTLTQSVGVNLDQLLKMQEEPEFAKIILRCEQITADGMPVVWLSRLFRDPLPARVPSVDIMEALLPVAEQKGYRVFMLGTKEELLQRAADNFRERFPNLQLAGTRNGYFKEEDEAEIVEQINASKTDILLIAISSPKKEEFVERNRAQLEVPFVMGVGGAFDIAAGQYTRAPKFVQKTGLEWAWRVAQEPKRMGPRVLHDLKFGKYVVREAAKRVRRRVGA